MRSAGLVWEREVGVGDSRITCQTSVLSVVRGRGETAMSGDNEESQVAEETSVDEKVTSAAMRISTLAATVAPLTLW